MKKFILSILILSMISMAAFASIDGSATPSSNTVNQNTDFYVSVTATSTQGIQAIRFVEKDIRHACNYGTSCNAQFTINENRLGSQTYTFEIIGESTIQRTATVNVVSGSGTPTQTPPALNIYAPSQVSKGSSFTISSNSNGLNGATIENIITIPSDLTSLGSQTTACNYASGCSSTYTRTISQTGTFSFTVSTKDSNRQTTSKTVSIQVVDSAPPQDMSQPQVTITSSNYNPKVGEAFTLTLSAQDDIQLTSVKLRNVNDGSIETLSGCNNVKSCTPTKTLSLSPIGTYQFQAIATDNSGNEKTNIATINVVSRDYNPPSPPGGNGGTPTTPTTTTPSNPSYNNGGYYDGPYAYIRLDSDSVWTNYPVTFNASLSRSPNSGAKITQYEWDFQGDDIVDLVTSNAIVTYTYNNEGFYRVRLFVTDSNGYSSAAYLNLQVRCCRPPQSSVSTGIFNITAFDLKGNLLDNAIVTITSNNSVYGRNTNNGSALIIVMPGCYNVTVQKKDHAFEKKENVCINSSEVKDVVFKESKGVSIFTRIYNKLSSIFHDKTNVVVGIPVAILIIVALVVLGLYLTDPLRFEERFDFSQRDEYQAV